MDAPARPQLQPLDEAWAPDGAPRAHYAALLDALAARDLGALGEDVARRAAELGVMHGAHDAAHPYALDPVPRVFTAAEWRMLEAGLVQRVRALEAFVADVHGPQASLRDGVVPREAVETCVWLEPPVLELPAPPVWIAVAGPDVVRDGEGRLVVLEWSGVRAAPRHRDLLTLWATTPDPQDRAQVGEVVLSRTAGWEEPDVGLLWHAVALEQLVARLTRADRGDGLDAAFARARLDEARAMADELGSPVAPRR